MVRSRTSASADATAVKYGQFNIWMPTNTTNT